MKKKSDEKIIEFIIRRHQIRSKLLNELGSRDEQILITVSLASIAGERLSITDLLHKKEIGSQIFMQNRMKFLLSKNLIEYVQVKHERRFQVIPGKVLWEYLDELGLVIQEIVE